MHRMQKVSKRCKCNYMNIGNQSIAHMAYYSAMVAHQEGHVLTVGRRARNASSLRLGRQMFVTLPTVQCPFSAKLFVRS